MGINRRPLDVFPFEVRGDRVKWPTLRGVRLEDACVRWLRNFVTTAGRSIIFLDGTYRTNLNFRGSSPVERAIFFEWLVRGRDLHWSLKGSGGSGSSGGIYILSWIGDFEGGSIIHFGYQWPQVQCWQEEESVAQETIRMGLHLQTFRIYKRIATKFYSLLEVDMDHEVSEFINQPMTIRGR